MKSPFDSPLSGFRSPFAYGRRLGGALAAYAVANLTPKLVFDFETETYATGGAVSTFDDSIDYTGDSLKTMVDSDGVLKWAPHNLLRYSEQFDNVEWSSTGLNITANDTSSPDGTLTADKVIPTTGNTLHSFELFALNQSDATFKVWVKNVSGDYYVFLRLYVDNQNWKNIYIRPSDGIVTTETSTSTTVIASGSSTDEGDGWHLFEVQWTGSLADIDLNFSNDGNRSAKATGRDIFVGDGTSGAYLWGAHTYRSDLGGMVNNPDRGDSYVPTTGSPVYLPRRGHHVWDGTSYVNEGLLVESEARTNLFLDSGDLTAAYWLNNRSTIAASGDGWFTLTQDATDFDGRLDGDVSISAGETMTVAIDARYVDRPFLAIRERLSNGSSETNYFNIQSGVLGLISLATTAQITEFNDGYRCSITFTNDGTARTGSIEFILSEDDNNVGVTVDGGKLDLRRPQAEVGATPSSYIPTAGATVTRAAETLTIPAAKLPYSSTNMSIQMEGRMTYADTNNPDEIVQLEWGLIPGFIKTRVRTNGSNSGKQTFFQEDEGGSPTEVQTAQLDYYTPGVLVPYNLAARHGSTFINGAVDGTALTADTTPTALPDLSASDLNLAPTYMGTLRQFRMFDDDLGDSGIESASS